MYRCQAWFFFFAKIVYLFTHRNREYQKKRKQETHLRLVLGTTIQGNISNGFLFAAKINTFSILRNKKSKILRHIPLKLASGDVDDLNLYVFLGNGDAYVIAFIKTHIQLKNTNLYAETHPTIVPLLQWDQYNYCMNTSNQLLNKRPKTHHYFGQNNQIQETYCKSQ